MEGLPQELELQKRSGQGDWYKWKVDPLHADMVVSAQLGRERSELYSDYSLAVWSDSQELVVVAKAYSGLSDKELKEVDRFVRANAGRFGPVRAYALKSSLRLPSKAFVFGASQVRRGFEVSKNQALAQGQESGRSRHFRVRPESGSVDGEPESGRSENR